MAEEVKCLITHPIDNTPPPVTDEEFERDIFADVVVDSFPLEVLASPYLHCSIAEQLGVPLRIVASPVPYKGYTGFNCIASLLLIGHDPTSRDFGMTPNGPFCGTAIVVSSDGEDLGSDAILRVMVDFLITFWNLVPIMTMPEGDDKQTAKENSVHVLSKEAFHAYFEERRRLAIAEGRPFRGKPKSPVLLKYPNVAPACGGCCAVSSSTVKLSKCGKCKFRHYCSKECQKKDWTTHKKACKVKL